MAKSRARLLAELLNASGRVKKDKSQLTGGDDTIDLDTLPTITNAKLQNSSISIAGHSTALGGSVSLNTGDITEHTDYKYYTDARVRAAISVDGNLSYNSTTGVLSYTQPTNISTFTNDSAYITSSANITGTSAGLSGTPNITVGTISSGAITSSGQISTTLESSSALKSRFIMGKASGSTANGELYLQYGSSDRVYIGAGTGGGAGLTVAGTLSSGAITSSGAIQGTSFSDGTISGITFIDEDSFATNSATRVPTQQSTKAYVDAQVAGVVDSAPSALNTLNELAAALGDDANFSTTTSTALGNRLRVDTAAQGLTGTQQANAITNLGITATKAELNYVDGVTSNIQTQLNSKQASGNYLTGNQTITLSGDASGSGTTSIVVTVADDSHNHVISNVDGLQSALNGKMASTGMADNADTYMNFRVIRNNNSTTSRDGMYIGYSNSNSGHTRLFGGGATSGGLYIRGSGANDLTYGNNTGTIWHSANDGSGSGLDADNLDGVTWGSYKSTGHVQLNVQAGNGYGLRFWNGNDNYKISMAAQNTTGYGRQAYEPNSDYNMYFRMYGGTNRGFVFQDGTSNKVGIDASGNIRADGIISSNNKQAMNCAHWSASGTSTGAIKIALPGTTSNYSMPVIEVTTYDYSSKAHVIYNISGHNWSTTSYWYNTRVTSEGGPPLTVRLGHDGTTHCIFIGDTTTSWSYGSVTVALKAHPAHYANNQNFTTGWGISQVTSIPSTTSAVTVGKIWHSSNDGSGSGLDADTVDGIQAASFLRSDAADTGTTITLTDAIRTNRFENSSGGFMFRWGTNTGTSGYVNFSDTTSDPSTSSASSNAKGISWGQRTDNNPYYMIYPYYYNNSRSSHTRLRLSWHTGVEIGGSSTYGGTRFFNDAPFNGSQIMSVGDGDNHVRVLNNLYIGGSNSNIAWHAGNDGSGSGLDADLLDGINGASYLRSDTDDTYSGNLTVNGMIFKNDSNTTRNFKIQGPSGNDVGISAFTSGGSHAFQLYGTNGTTYGFLDSNWGNWDLQVTKNGGLTKRVSGGTATIWHSSNDGSGSGLDADTLDGINSSQFLRSDASDSMSGELNITYNTGITGTSAPTYSNGQIEVQTSSNHVPAIGFHRGGYSATTLYEYDGELYVNAWTTRNQTGKLVSFGNDGSGSGLDADLLDGQQGSYYAKYDHFRSLGKPAFTGTASTAGLISEMEGDGAFDSYTSAFKTSWSYAGNFNMSDAGRFTETAGTAFLTWTDNSSDSARGNITVLAIAPNTGGSAGKMFVYNDQGSNYAPGWREIWTSTSDGSGSGLDADTLDGVQLSNIARTDVHETFGSNVTINGVLYMGSGNNDGYFFNDTNGRTAFAGGDFYIQNSVGNYYNYATNQYIGDSSGDNIYFRGNTLSGNGWSLTGAGAFTTSGVIDVNGGHGGLNITNSSILSSATSTWTGNPGGSGKIQYHSNRWYIVSDSSSNRIVQFRRDGSNKSYIENDGTFNGPKVTLSGQFAYTAPNYGHGIFGVYSATRYQHVWSMGTAYKTSADGTSYGNMYGLTFTHTNIGTGSHQAISGLGHQLQLRMNGSLYAAMGSGLWTSGNVTAYSDIAVKRNLVKIPNALEKVRSINGYTYERTDYVKDEEDPEAPDILRQAGVVAQEIEKVLPEVVSGPEGNKAVAYGNIVALLIEAIKEQQNQIEELKEIINGSNV